MTDRMRDRPWIQNETIGVDYFLYGIPSGDAFLCVYPKEERIVWVKFYPLHHFPELQRRGIGSLAHAKTIWGIWETYPTLRGFEIGHEKFTHPNFRFYQLVKMGINPEQPLLFPKYLKLSLTYVMKKGFDFEKELKEVENML